MMPKTRLSLDRLQRHFDEISEMDMLIGELVQKYLSLKLNIRRCGGPVDEKITLNLREADWPKQYIYCQAKFGNRILGMDINWIVAEGE